MSTVNGENVIVIDIALDEDNNLQKIEESAVLENADIGFIKPYAGTSIPEGYLLCNGAAISRAQYPELFAAIGTTWGAGDGASTFNVPDLRGFFLRGVGGDSAALGVEQGDAIRDLTGALSYVVMTPDLNTHPAGASGVFSGHLIASGGMGGGGGHQNNIAFSASGSGVPTADENRPVNKAVNYCIRYA